MSVVLPTPRRPWTTTRRELLSDNRSSRRTASMTFGADIAVIHLGINDTDPRDWPNYRDEFVRDYLALIDSLKSSNKKIRFISVMIFALFLFLSLLICYLLIGGIKIRLKISIFYGEKVVHLADF